MERKEKGLLHAHNTLLHSEQRACSPSSKFNLLYGFVLKQPVKKNNKKGPLHAHNTLLQSEVKLVSSSRSYCEQ